jgi:hypothetical protein
MITQELIDAIIVKYKAGETKLQLKEDLISQGYDENDIDDAISHIQKTALMQFRGVAVIVGYVTLFNQYVTKQSVGHSMRILGGLCVFMIIIAIILYHIFSQYQTNAPLSQPNNTLTAVTVTPSVMQAQFPITGSVQKVTGSKSALGTTQAFPGVLIRVVDQTGGLVCQVKTDAQGVFNCNAANPGTFIVSASQVPNYAFVGPSSVTIVEPNTTDSKALFTLNPIH